MMRRSVFVLIFALGVLPTSAQQDKVWNKFEITPFVGFHFGGKIRTREVLDWGVVSPEDVGQLWAAKLLLKAS